MTAPILTIVTINRDNAAGVRQTLGSLRPVAARNDVELIFVDGASHDDSVALARALYAPDLIVSEPDSGVYDAMNKGLRLANGRFVLWINSGDELLPRALPQAMSLLQAERADLVCFGIQAVSADARTSRELLSDVRALPHTILHHQGACFRRTTALELGGYDQRYRIVGDQDLMQRMYLAGRKIVSHPLVLSRFHEGGLSFTRARFVEEYEMQRRLGIISPWRHARLRADLWVQGTKQAIKGRLRRLIRGAGARRAQTGPVSK